jgi:hypothetical protein
LRTEALEALRVFFDVDLDRHESIVDERSYTLVGVYLGIQPSARPSHWGGTEIKQDSAPVRLSLLQAAIDILLPFHSHEILPPRLIEA